MITQGVAVATGPIHDWSGTETSDAPLADLRRLQVRTEVTHTSYFHSIIACGWFQSDLRIPVNKKARKPSPAMCTGGALH